MTFESHLRDASASLKSARELIQEELRAYPTPVSGCDAQYNHLISLKNAVNEALGALETPPFVATPRTPFPEAGVESR
ncbi:MAG: hypothetical protein AAGF74_06740 [Pseudomonadota bacterium]